MGGTEDELLELADESELALPMISFARFADDVASRVEESFAIVRGTTDRRWTYLLERTPDGARALADALSPEDRAFAAVERSLADRLFSERPLLWRSEGWTLVWPREISYPEAVPPDGFAVTPLPIEHAELVDAFWGHHHAGSLKLIRRCISRGPAVCTRAAEGEIAGWSLVLDDGAIGASYVLPKLRGLGIHTAQVAALAAELTARGEWIFRHIAEDANRGLERYTRLGFRSVGRTSWLELDEGSLSSSERD